MSKLYNDLKIRLLGMGYPFLRLMFLLAVVASFATIQFVGAQQAASEAISSAICGIFNTIKTAIFIFALMLIVLGASLYAGSNLMTSQVKGTMQGYGMGMIVGGIVGIVIVLAAPYILTTIINIGGGTVLSTGQTASTACASS